MCALNVEKGMKLFMNKNDYLKIVKKKIKNKKSRMILIDQIETYFDLCEYSLEQHNYKIGDNVYLSKDTNS